MQQKTIKKSSERMEETQAQAREMGREILPKMLEERGLEKMNKEEFNMLLEQAVEKFSQQEPAERQDMETALFRELDQELARYIEERREPEQQREQGASETAQNRQQKAVEIGETKVRDTSAVGHEEIPGRGAGKPEQQKAVEIGETRIGEQRAQPPKKKKEQQ